MELSSVAGRTRYAELKDDLIDAEGFSPKARRIIADEEAKARAEQAVTRPRGQRFAPEPVPMPSEPSPEQIQADEDAKIISRASAMSQAQLKQAILHERGFEKRLNEAYERRSANKFKQRDWNFKK